MLPKINSDKGFEVLGPWIIIDGGYTNLLF